MLAITLRFDPVTASIIEEMWRFLAAEGIDADCRDLGYAPHITLAVYPNDAPISRLRGALHNAASRWDALPITLSGFGVFPAPFASLWLAPVVTSALLARHAAIEAALPGLQAHPHYRAGAWMPHVTLSGVLKDPASALARLLASWRPLAGTLVQLDLVRFRPVEIVQSHALRLAG